MASRRIVIVALLSGAVDCVSTAAFAATAAFSSSSMLSIVQKRIVPTPSSDQARKRHRPLSTNHLPPGADLARSAAVRTSRAFHGLGMYSTPGGSWPRWSTALPDVRTTTRCGQRIFTSRAKPIPSISPESRTSAKIIATSLPRRSIVASAASALSHSMMSNWHSSSITLVNHRSSVSSSTTNTFLRLD